MRFRWLFLDFSLWGWNVLNFLKIWGWAVLNLFLISSKSEAHCSYKKKCVYRSQQAERTKYEKCYKVQISTFLWNFFSWMSLEWWSTLCISLPDRSVHGKVQKTEVCSFYIQSFSLTECIVIVGVRKTGGCLCVCVCVCLSVCLSVCKRPAA